MSEGIGRWERPYVGDPGPSVAVAYDTTYADRYDEDWWAGDRWGPEGDHHVRMLTPLLVDGARWLDCGCGTGWLLSRFPEVDRAGFDLSETMLRHARANNPTARFVEQGDLRADNPAWHRAFDVVTCTGQPWMYLPSLDEVATMVGNFAGFTADDGVCIVPIADITDFVGLPLDANPAGDLPPEGPPVITGAFWSQLEYGSFHRHMIAPSLSTWIEMFARWFREVEVVRWPHEPEWLPVARRVMVGRRPRREGDEGPTTVIVHPVPPVEGAEPTPEASTVDDPQQPGPAAASEPELAPEPVPEPEPIPEPAGHERAAPPPDPRQRPGRPLPGRLVDQPLTYLVGKAKPWDKRFWGRVARRAPGRNGS